MSPTTHSIERTSYAQLLEEVEVLAAVMVERGVKYGDTVLVYMPMVPAALYAMLAAARIGAVHVVVFGGFAAASLAQRIEACRPTLIMTASCAIEGTKDALSYRPMVREALRISAWKPTATIIWQRDILRWSPVVETDGDLEWQALVSDAKSRDLKADCRTIQSTDSLYIIYTSGTTGSPKGVRREAGGHAVGLHLSMKYIYNIRRGDVIFTASDIGWVVGHSYIVYAPVLVGATTILYEGKPTGTPDAGQFWRIIERYNVRSLFTAPSALRGIQQADPQLAFLKEVGRRGGLKRLRGLFLAGERSESSLVTKFQSLLCNYCDAQVIDHWWSSESGSPITGIALTPSINRPVSDGTSQKPISTRPGSAGKPMPGFDVRIVDDNGQELGTNQVGNIVLNVPLAPTAFTTLFEDEARFYSSYLKRFTGRWLDSGDTGLIDNDGYVFVMGRSDDVINVAAHRFSTGAIEQAILSHPNVTEAAVIGVPHNIKGYTPFAFITVATQMANSSTELDPASPSRIFKEVNDLVRNQIGAIASLGGIIQGRGMIPKTRSGKTLRRTLKELMVNAMQGNINAPVDVPTTIDDASTIEVAKKAITVFLHNQQEVKKAKAKL